MTTASELRAVITQHDAHRPRSQQTRIGPSQVGVPCTRQLAWERGEAGRIQPEGDKWASIQGTYSHAGAAEAFTWKNQQLGRDRYLIEHSIEIGVEAGPNLTGSVDLYDRDTRTVTDHKFVGENRIRVARRDGPGDQYRTQIHLYGLGLTLQGHLVETVQVAFWPRTAYSHGLYVWDEPYDETIAEAALERLYQVDRILDGARGEAARPIALMIPATPSHACTWCPAAAVWPLTDTGGCPGQQREAQPTLNTEKERREVPT